MIPEARPLYLFGGRRLDELGVRVQRVLPELSREWWRQDNRLQLVAVSAWDEALRSSSLSYILRGSEGQWLAFLGTEHAWLKLAESWLGCDVPVDTPLVGTLRREFCLALYRQLIGPEAVAVVLERAGWSEIPISSLKQGGGALVIELDVEGIPVTLLAPVTLWADLASWPAAPTSAAVQPIAAALADTTLQVEVRLPTVRVPATDMGALAVGDFLDLEHDLSGRVRIIGERAQVHLSGVLGQREGRKAVRIEHHNGSRE